MKNLDKYKISGNVAGRFRNRRGGNPRNVKKDVFSMPRGVCSYSYCSTGSYSSSYSYSQSDSNSDSENMSQIGGPTETKVKNVALERIRKKLLQLGSPLVSVSTAIVKFGFTNNLSLSCSATFRNFKKNTADHSHEKFSAVPAGRCAFTSEYMIGSVLNNICNFVFPILPTHAFVIRLKYSPGNTIATGGNIADSTDSISNSFIFALLLQ